jgi:hypothetical protein
MNIVMCIYLAQGAAENNAAFSYTDIHRALFITIRRFDQRLREKK